VIPLLNYIDLKTTNMETPEIPTPTNDPGKEKGNKGNNDKNAPNPSRPDNDPDQTPERETSNPPVAPNKEKKAK
jgi:hypothetical protein